MWNTGFITSGKTINESVLVNQISALAIDCQLLDFVIIVCESKAEQAFYANMTLRSHSRVSFVAEHHGVPGPVPDVSVEVDAGFSWTLETHQLGRGETMQEPTGAAMKSGCSLNYRNK